MTSEPGRRITLLKHRGGHSVVESSACTSSEPFSQYRRFGSKNTTGSSQAIAARSMS